ncbi:MAG: hypothetical protein ACR2FH_00700 [Caulobacteraceae bacterium]
MAPRIANPVVVARVERPARAREAGEGAQPVSMAALLAQIDRVPDRADAFDPLEWDEAGLPK